MLGAPSIVPEVGRGICLPSISTYYYLGGLSGPPIQGSPTRQLQGSPQELKSYIAGQPPVNMQSLHK